jgi:hypothetical protein
LLAPLLNGSGASLEMFPFACISRDSRSGLHKVTHMLRFASEQEASPPLSPTGL